MHIYFWIMSDYSNQLYIQLGQWKGGGHHIEANSDIFCYGLFVGTKLFVLTGIYM